MKRFRDDTGMATEWQMWYVPEMRVVVRARNAGSGAVTLPGYSTFQRACFTTAMFLRS
jgi:hypothetical protein